MFAHRRIGHHSHLHPVFRVTGYATDNRSFILFHNPPYQRTISAFGRFIKELHSEISLRIGRLSYHQKAGSIFIDSVYQTDMRVISIVIGIIFHVPGYGIDKRTMVVSMSGMYNESGWFIHYHQKLVFIDNIKRNIFGNNFIFIARTIHHHRDNIERFHFVAALHRLTVGHDKTTFRCFLNAVTRCIHNTFEQIFVHPHHRLAFINYHAKMLVQLSLRLLTDRFYIIYIIIPNVVGQFLNHIVSSLLY